ncbi:copper ion binding [Zostera marina]|uniref:Copper ion binding n=1 Tax=Zostera marina TaxID=29655 RepID=A0A0K9PL45_ZOSMR|nr:copper ion binding [Zostera marina]
MDDSFTVQISSGLINRLVGDEKKAKKKPKKLKPSKPLQNSVTHGGWSVRPPIVTPAPSAVNGELESIKSILEESKMTVEKLKKQEDDMVRELTERAKELHEKEFKLPYQKPMPCTDAVNDCKKCYEENAENPLKCSDVVNKLVHCAREARSK